jgi:hypothetical protein
VLGRSAAQRPNWSDGAGEARPQRLPSAWRIELDARRERDRIPARERLLTVSWPAVVKH